MTTNKANGTNVLRQVRPVQGHRETPLEKRPRGKGSYVRILNLFACYASRKAKDTIDVPAAPS